MSETQMDPGAWAVSPTLSLLRLGEAWLMEDPARGSHRILNTLPGWLGRALATLISAETVTTEEAHSALKAAGVPEGHVGSCLRSFTEAGVLVHAGTSRPHRDAGSMRDRQWAVISPPVDYRDPTAKDADVQLMYSYAEQAAVPPCATQVPEAWARIPLPEPEETVGTGGSLLDTLGRLLYLTNGVQSEIEFGPLPRSRRTPPSFGASHPFDISVRAPSGTGERTNYYYQPVEHALVVLPPPEQVCGTGSARLAVGGELEVDLSIHLAIERVHWRYRTSTVYPTVLLDLGHVTETLRLVAQSLGVSLVQTSGRTEPTLPKSDHVLGPILRQYRARWDQKS
ncbi:hypothetical protein ACLMNJ_16255 [Streptomyces seoulensis]